MMSPSQLKERADAVNAARAKAAHEAKTKLDAEYRKRVAAKITECHVAMQAAADNGSYSCEVEVTDEYEALAREFRDYNPRPMGDGYGHNVINLSWGTR